MASNFWGSSLCLSAGESKMPDQLTSSTPILYQTEGGRAPSGAPLAIVDPSTAHEPTVLPFTKLPEDEVEPYVNCVPLLDLKVAAGGFSPEQIAADIDAQEWVQLHGHRKPSEELFVAQVVGESMNRRIPNGSWCLWRANPAGTRQGKVVLAQHRDIYDSELGGRYTVKVYESEKESNGEGGWRHSRIILKPDSDEASFEPIVLDDLENDELRIVAELVEVL